MKKYGSIVLLAALTACSGGGGASVNKSKAETPATVVNARADLAGAVGVLELTSSFRSIAGMMGGAAAGSVKATVSGKLAEKLRALEDTRDGDNTSDDSDSQDDDSDVGLGEFCSTAPTPAADGSISCNCKDGGSFEIKVSGSSTSLQSGSGTAKVKVIANNCKASNSEGSMLMDATIEMTLSGSSSGLSIDMSMDGRIEESKADGTIVFALIVDNLVQSINSSMNQAGYQAALAEYQAEATTNPNAQMPSIDDYFTLEMTIDGAIDYTDAEATCANGVYVFETIEPLKTGGHCGYKAGKIKINGVSYAFAESEVTLGDGLSGTISCEELHSNVCSE